MGRQKGMAGRRQAGQLGMRRGRGDRDIVQKRTGLETDLERWVEGRKEG